MALDLLRPPAEALASLQAVTPLLCRHPAVAAHMPGVAEAFAHPEQSTNAEPMLSVRVYILDADAIMSGRDLSGLKPVLWSHFLAPATAPDGRLMMADTGLDSSRVESIFEGPVAAEFLPEIQRLESDPRVRHGRFELAELRAPSAHVVALWLKDQQGDDHVFVPFGGHQAALQRGRHYPPQAFIDALRPAAAAARQQRPGHASGANGG